MAWQIIWSARAQKDRENIFQFWNDHNGSTNFSQKLYDLFNNNFDILKTRPFIGQKTTKPNVYVIVVLKFLIYYKVQENAVIVMHIRDGRRKPYILKS